MHTDTARGVPLQRIARRAVVRRTPSALPGEPGLFVVDGTWGTITPMQVAPGVRTVGELEVIAHLRGGLPVVDTRLPEYVREGTIPGARAISHELLERELESGRPASELLDPGLPAVLFCNGPLCTATPQAILALLRAGHPAASLLYYRGGIHDWVTAGLPLSPPQGAGADAPGR